MEKSSSRVRRFRGVPWTVRTLALLIPLALFVILARSQWEVGPAGLAVQNVLVTAGFLILLSLVILLPVALWRFLHGKAPSDPMAIVGAVAALPVTIDIAAFLWFSGGDVLDGYRDAWEGPRVAHDAHFVGVSTWESSGGRAVPREYPAYHFETDDGPLEFRVHWSTAERYGDELEAFQGGDLLYYPRTMIWVPAGG